MPSLWPVHLPRRHFFAATAGALLSPAPELHAQGPTHPARVMLPGLFYFDNPGLDAVRYRAFDVMQIGFRVARRAGLTQVHGISQQAPGSRHCSPSGADG